MLSACMHATLSAWHGRRFERRFERRKQLALTKKPTQHKDKPARRTGQHRIAIKHGSAALAANGEHKGTTALRWVPCQVRRAPSIPKISVQYSSTAAAPLFCSRAPQVAARCANARWAVSAPAVLMGSLLCNPSITCPSCLVPSAAGGQLERALPELYASQQRYDAT